MKKILLLSLTLFFSLGIFAQETTKNFADLTYFQDTLGASCVSGTGNVTITQDTRLEQLMTNYARAFKRQHQTVWRVQIYFGTGRSGRAHAQSIKNNFESSHPGTSAYLIFEEPYFKVRVGNYSTRLDAERLKIQLSEDYSSLFIVEDKD